MLFPFFLGFMTTSDKNVIFTFLIYISHIEPQCVVAKITRSPDINDSVLS